MKKILVPTDFSAAAEDALKLASTLADKTGAEIYLINFLEHPFDESFSTSGDYSTKFDDEETLFTIQLLRRHKSLLEELATRYTEGRVLNIQVYGEDLVDGIENFIRKEAIDFIVMGTTGEETAKEFFTGNHTEQVIERVNCPVLSLRAGQHEVDFSRMVVGVDYKEDKHANYLAATRYLSDFASAVGAELNLIHVNKPNSDSDDDSKKLEEFADKFGLSNFTTGIQFSNDIESGLLRSVTALNAGVVCVLTSQEGGFFRIFSHSVSEDLSKESDVPVLSINLHRV